uniref:Uncharacterized protein n=1 Tax=Arion vulgaris TaxID=1028688 RepID=A0A0B6YY34_9EUPU
MALPAHLNKRHFPTLPHESVIIDASYSRLCYAARQCLVCHSNKSIAGYVSTLQHLWTSNTSNSNHVLPCLCVRTALDLFLQVKGYPAGSEVIMSAVNIQVSPAYIVTV